MLRAKMGMAALCAALMTAPGIGGQALADQATIDTAYDAYRSEMQNGNLRAARDHARAAYERALAEYGRNAHELSRYAAAYAKTLNDLLAYEDASELLAGLVDTGEDDAAAMPITFPVAYELGRAYRGQTFFAAAERIFSAALQLAESTYGPDSLQAAYAHMELAKPRLDYSNWRFHNDTLNRVVGTGFGYSAGSEESLARAEEIFTQLGAHEIERELLNVSRAGNLMAAEDRRAAGEVLEPALEALASYGYMNDEVLTLYVDWVGMHVGNWSVRRLERKLTRAFELGALRGEGAPIPLARTFAIIDRRVCIDHISGYIVMEFSVNEAGQLPRIRTHETSHPDQWDREVWRTMRGWAYIPGQAGGAVTRVNGLLERWEFSGESRDC